MLRTTVIIAASQRFCQVPGARERDERNIAVG